MTQAPPHHDRVESNLMMSLAEHLIENESRIDANINKSNLLVTSSQMPEILDARHHYQQENNILDFYQLQPMQNVDIVAAANTNTNSNATRPHFKDANEGDDEEIVQMCDYAVEMRVPVDINALPHGEEFKPHESTIYDDNTYVKSTKSSVSPVTNTAPNTQMTLNDYNDGNDSCQTEMNDSSFIEDIILGMKRYLGIKCESFKKFPIFCKIVRSIKL
jgi:hypothetical protein